MAHDIGNFVGGPFHQAVHQEMDRTTRELRRNADRAVYGGMAMNDNPGVFARAIQEELERATYMARLSENRMVYEAATEGQVRQFETGATRDTEEGKLDYEGFLSPEVLAMFAAYMHRHRVQADGKLRDSDNWQKGMPKTAYMKSLFRHFMDVWQLHRNSLKRPLAPMETAQLEEALCAMFFNVQGYMFELQRNPEPRLKPDAKPEPGTIVVVPNPAGTITVRESIKRWLDDEREDVA